MSNEVWQGNVSIRIDESCSVCTCARPGRKVGAKAVSFSCPDNFCRFIVAAAGAARCRKSASTRRVHCFYEAKSLSTSDVQQCKTAFSLQFPASCKGPGEDPVHRTKLELGSWTASPELIVASIGFYRRKAFGTIGCCVRAQTPNLHDQITVDWLGRV